jgi:preprotein translocase subunit SecD
VASAKGSMKPGRLLGLFAVLAAVIYILVFFTGSKSTTPKLGIDLQGGTSVVLTPRDPDGRPPSQDALHRAQQIIDSRVNGLGVAGSEVVIDGNNLVITVPGTDSSQARSLGQTAKLYIRPVIGGPTPAAAPSGASSAPTSSTTTGADQTAAAIKAARAKLQSTNSKEQAQAAATLDCSKPNALEGNDDPNLPLVACDKTGKAVYLLGPSIIDGQAISNASWDYDTDSAQNRVTITFTDAASKKWADFTSANINKQAAFVLDSSVISAPEIQDATPAGSPTQITGQFSQSQAADLANQLKYGSLPLSFAQSDAQTVSATLGLSSLHAGLLAGIVGLAAVLLYCLWYYRALGFLVAISLGCSGVAIYGLLVLLGRWIDYTLELSGIAGLIIGIGMTADSFVVFFERIKDEVREGRSFRSAVPRGWVRARRTILSSNAVSFIAAAVLYEMAIGEVKGFAFTLGLSTILDTIVVFLITAPLITLASRAPFWAKPSVNGLGAIQQVARERNAARVPARGRA